MEKYYAIMAAAGILLPAADIIVGWLPDKYAKYPGVILTLAHKMYSFGKEIDPKK
jgi:hypothetical protein